MDSQVRGVRVRHVEHGTGLPLVALHGAGVDHREIEAAVEAVVPDAGLRRIYPDLPGMGRSTADGLTSNDDVVTVLVDLIDQLTEGPVLLLGHSYGAYLARGVAARRPDLVLGLALVCPLAERTGQVPEHQVVRQDDDAHGELAPEQRAGFDEYVVVRTRATARRYRDHVLPGTTLVDETALARVLAGWAVDLGAGGYAGPTLVVAGRRDSTVGYADAVGLLADHPHATLAIVEDAGHALPHERPELLGALLADWVDRATRVVSSSRSTVERRRHGSDRSGSLAKPPTCPTRSSPDGEQGRPVSRVVALTTVARPVLQPAVKGLDGSVDGALTCGFALLGPRVNGILRTHVRTGREVFGERVAVRSRCARDR